MIYLYFENIVLNMSEKERKLGHWPFQENWTNKYGFVKLKQNIVLFVLFVVKILSIAHLVYTLKLNDNLSLKPQKRKVKRSKKAISGFKKQTSILRQAVGTKNKACSGPWL